MVAPSLDALIRSKTEAPSPGDTRAVVSLTVASTLLGLSAALLALATSGSSARKAPYTLEDMVEGAGLICIGRVEEILVVESPEPVAGRTQLPIARVAVERWIKGDAGTPFVHHEAWTTWACDSTGAEVGERALLFLCRNGVIGQSSASVQSAVQLHVGTDEIYRNWNSGSGILPILEEEGIEYVGTTRGVDIGVPLSDAWFLRKLSDQVEHIEGLLRFPRGSVSVLAQRGWDTFPEGGTFDLRILENGEVRLATRLERGEEVRIFTLEPGVWQSLKRELEVLVGDEPREAGLPMERWLVRRLVLRVDGSTLTFGEPTGWSPRKRASPAERFALQDALRAWTLVREVAGPPDPDPHAEKDRLWLGY